MFTRLGLFDGKPDSRRAALLDFCAEALAVARDRLRLAHDPLGAPALLIDGARTEWNVSSSSREDVFFFGLIWAKKIGVDVEVARPLDVPDAALNDQERSRLAALPEAAREIAFYELWTTKEAYVKALGVGLRRDLAEIEIASGAVPAITDGGRPVASAGTRTWRGRLGGKDVVCTALTLPMKSQSFI